MKAQEILLLFALLLIQLGWSGGPCAAAVSVKAQAGEIDLSEWQGIPSYSLYGDWYFAGKELLTPESFLKFLAQGRSFQTTQIGLSLPESDPKKIKGPRGYGTYIVRLKNLPAHMQLGMVEVATYVSGRIFFFDSKGNGGKEPLRNLGFVTKNPKLAKSEISNNEVLPFMTGESGDYFLLIQVANHHHSWGGLWSPPTLGALPLIIEETANNTKANYFVFGVMIFICFYNAMLYIHRREDKGSLYLALVCLTLLVRTWFFANYGRDFFGDGYWGVQLSLKVIYITAFTLPWASFQSVKVFFPKQTPTWMSRLIPIYSLLCIVFIALTPSRIFGPLSNLWFSSGLIMGLSSSYIAARAAMAKEAGARIVIFGVFSVLVGAILEYLTAVNIIQWARNAMTFGMAVYAASLSQIISTRFAQAYRQAEHLSQELHAEVQRQTRDIRSLLDNLNQGIFTIVEGSQLIGSQFSGYLKRIIGKDRIEGQTLRTLLLDHSNLSTDRKDMIEAAVNASLGEDVMNFEVNASILARDMTYQAPESQKFQHLELDWSPIYDDNEKVEKLLVSVRDVTEILRLKEEARLREEDFEILKEVVDVAEDRFMRFLHKAREFLQENKRIIGHPQAEDSVQRLFINMHSLKGIARSYSLANLANAIHHAEETLSRLRAGTQHWNEAQLETERHGVELVLEHYERIALDKLGWVAAGASVRIVKPKIEELIRGIQLAAKETSSSAGLQRLALVEQHLLEMCHQPFSQVIEEASRGLDSLARSLNKEPPRLSVRVEGVILQDAAASTLHGVLTHLLRNSLDHGLETAELRQSLGKPPFGHIRIESRASGDSISISYEDDGQGLDLLQLERKAREQGHWDESRALDENDIAELIFVSGFSTKSHVTEISGRGVGMDAVRSMLQNLGGDVAIRLGARQQQGRRPFRIYLLLPMHAFIRGAVAERRDLFPTSA